MPANRFRKCAQAITDTELDALAELAGYPLPDFFRTHYLASNGGVPERAWWDSLDEYPPCKVSEFCAVTRGRHSMESLIARLRSKNLLPDGLLPFALGGANQYFCLDLKSGAVLLYSPDVNSPCSRQDEEEPRCPTRKLSRNFKEFVKGLVSEDEID